MASIMLASVWVVPFYPKPVSFSSFDRTNIAHCAQCSVKGEPPPRVVFVSGHSSSQQREDQCQLLISSSKDEKVVFRRGLVALAAKVRIAGETCL